jgi:hypothetical protein
VPFAQVLEWFDSQVSMEKVYRFPLLQLKPLDAPPASSSPQKRGAGRGQTGKQWENSKETQSTGTFRIWIPAFVRMRFSDLSHPFARNSEVQHSRVLIQGRFVCVMPFLLKPLKEHEESRELRHMVLLC